MTWRNVLSGVVIALITVGYYCARGRGRGY